MKSTTYECKFGKKRGYAEVPLGYIIFHIIKKEHMEYTVQVKFRKNSDYSNANKNLIIFSLPGPYRITQENLNDMDQLGAHLFSFPNFEPANNFAKELFRKYSSIFDIKTNFELNIS